MTTALHASPNIFKNFVIHKNLAQKIKEPALKSQALLFLSMQTYN